MLSSTVYLYFYHLCLYAVLSRWICIKPLYEMSHLLRYIESMFSFKVYSNWHLLLHYFLSRLVRKVVLLIIASPREKTGLITFPSSGNNDGILSYRYTCPFGSISASPTQILQILIQLITMHFRLQPLSAQHRCYLIFCVLMQQPY